MNYMQGVLNMERKGRNGSVVLSDFLDVEAFKYAIFTTPEVSHKTIVDLMGNSISRSTLSNIIRGVKTPIGNILLMLYALDFSSKETGGKLLEKYNEFTKRDQFNSWMSIFDKWYYLR